MIWILPFKMSTYKLTYFNFRGNAEICRLVFAASGQEYQDVRISFEDWKELKPTTPYGQLPILEVDGTTLCQSRTIARYLAKHFGLAGKTDLELAQADMIVDCIEDMKNILYPIYFAKEEDEKAKLKEEFGGKWIAALKQLDDLLLSNTEGEAYFVGDEITWADLAFINMVQWPASIGLHTDLSTLPRLQALQERVEAIPNVARWITERPDTPR